METVWVVEREQITKNSVEVVAVFSTVENAKRYITNHADRVDGVFTLFRLVEMEVDRE